MSANFLLSALLALVTVMRWLWLAPQDLSPTGAYLALCGYTPSIAYFDGPGGTALGVAAGLSVAGGGALGAALLWPLFAALATMALYHLVSPISGARTAAAACVLLNLLPAFNTAAVLPTCAAPLAMFALAFAAFAWRALDRSSLAYWLAAGFCAAGGLIFDYLAVFFLPALFVVMVSSHRWRPQLLEPGFWLACLPPAGVFLWLLVWNSDHDWVHFIGGTWQTALALDLRRLPPALLSAASGASPLILLALAAGLLFSLREMGHSRQAKFLAVPALTALALAAYLGLRGEPAAAAGLVAAALAVPLACRLPVPPAGAAAVLVASALWTTFMTASMRPHPTVVNAEVAAEIEKLRAAHTADPSLPVFLIARDAPLASALALYLPQISFVAPGHPPVYVIESPFADSQYALWPRYDQFVDAPPAASDGEPDPFTEQDGTNLFLWRSALYVTPQKPDALPQAITAAFASHRLLAEIGTPSGEILRVYLCSEYETLPL
jgi:4-amino-4-deoxy-L-arabinose transferase-like glycosyltransferase